MKENVDDDLEYHLEDPGENPLPTKKCSTKTKILFSILIILFILFTGATAYFAYKYLDSRKSKKSDKEKIIPPDSETDDSKIIEVDSSNGFLYWETYGTKISNLSYVKENETIYNSFKEGGENYNIEIGNINYGEDYIKSERNIYDLYIPYTATQRKEKNNKVLLFIHGGGWMTGQKEYMDGLCKSYAKYGIITASIGYTLIEINNTQTNMNS